MPPPVTTVASLPASPRLLFVVTFNGTRYYTFAMPGGGAEVVEAADLRDFCLRAYGVHICQTTGDI
ncbi:hypothetical protein ONS96_005291 [Cadophora gregata f. sp. sojae]|nr:hypothetical protein ONS96_005291 [Cadophora gregata f. sp. sojae]